MNHSFTDEEILTREEVMDVLKIGRSTFYKLIKSGDLKGFLEGNRYKVPAKSITSHTKWNPNENYPKAIKCFRAFLCLHCCHAGALEE